MFHIPRVSSVTLKMYRVSCLHTYTQCAQISGAEKNKPTKYFSKKNKMKKEKKNKSNSPIKSPILLGK